jgi:hypothetical protein
MAADKGPVTAADAADALARGMTAATNLLARPDTDGTMAAIGGQTPHSTEPWNAAAGAALMTAHQAVRDLENELLIRDGLQARYRGGSTANTLRALEQVVIRAGNGHPADAAMVTRRLFGLAAPAERLPAVDERASWLPIRGGDDGRDSPACPLCGTWSLRLAEQSMALACFYQGPPCRDGSGGGLRILGRLAWSAVTADPVLIWEDDVLAEIAERADG